MCVIMICDSKSGRPSPTMVEKAWGRNDDGAGIAWREKYKGEPHVFWKKGLDEEEMADLVAKVPLPFVAHWRIASCGGVRAELTHPFPIGNEASLALEGKTKGYVLFHNGTWANWAGDTRYAAIQKDTPIPNGKWSDSRAMAWLMSMYGHGFMELLPEQRGVAFGPDKMDIFVGPGWVKIDDIWCSNNNFVSYHAKSSHQSSGNLVKQLCQYFSCTETNLDADKRCARHPKTSFPTDGRSQGVTPASPLPFPKQNPQGQIISLEVAAILHAQKNKDGSRRLSKNCLKEIRKSYSRMAQANDAKKVAKARTELVRLSTPYLSLLGSLLPA